MNGRQGEKERGLQECFTAGEASKSGMDLGLKPGFLYTAACVPKEVCPWLAPISTCFFFHFSCDLLEKSSSRNRHIFHWYSCLLVVLAHVKVGCFPREFHEVLSYMTSAVIKVTLY